MEPSLEELYDFIDWMPYFNAWEFSGRFPDILNDPAKGKEAKKLWNDTQVVLNKLMTEKWIKPKGIIGLFPARSIGDTIAVTKNDGFKNDGSNEEMLFTLSTSTKIKNGS